MQTERGREFKNCEPTITREDVEKAEQSGNGIVSFDVKPFAVDDEKIGFAAFKVVLQNGTTTTLLLDEIAGRALWAFLQRLEEFDWKILARPGDMGTLQ